MSGFDIDLYTFLSFNYNRDMCDFLYQNIQPFGNIFKDEFCQVVNNPTILTEIRIAIQKLLESDIMVSQQEQVPEQQETNDEEYNEEEEGAEY